MAETDLIDAIGNPKLMADLENRCRGNLDGLRSGTFGILSGTKVQPFEYTDEPIDKWTALSVAADQFPGQTMVVDCDDLVGKWGAFWKSRTGKGAPVRVGVAISQPKTRDCAAGRSGKIGRRCGYGMAHTYNVLDMGPDFRYPFDFQGALVKSDTLRNWLAERGDEGSGSVFVWDGSVGCGMDRPSPSFYGSGETHVLWMPDGEVY